jgi:hypothetical protein
MGGAGAGAITFDGGLQVRVLVPSRLRIALCWNVLPLTVRRASSLCLCLLLSA